ncbi:hemerythrin domain-containing protein [Gudongella sp. SC589]|uniref:hemerythrin domain-containing protein n=1 Tax=Gudongella sp. SC589 TaxID=3385990 RepID=UPI0039049267
MKSIEIMVKEHENIRRMLKVLREVSYRIMTGGKYDLEDLPEMIDFVRNYADKLHHGKEEDILFEAMNAQIEKLAKSGAITGMYIEHDQGRLFIANLESGYKSFKEGDDRARLDIIGNAIAYTDLLDRHIEKENTALYKFAENMLPDEIKSKVDADCDQVENEATISGTQARYLNMLDIMEDKYRPE